RMSILIPAAVLWAYSSTCVNYATQVVVFNDTIYAVTSQHGDLALRGYPLGAGTRPPETSPSGGGVRGGLPPRDRYLPARLRGRVPSVCRAVGREKRVL